MVDGSSSDKNRERESSNSSQQGETWSPACLMVLVSVAPVAEEGMSRATNHSTWKIDPKMKEMRCIANHLRSTVPDRTPNHHPNQMIFPLQNEFEKLRPKQPRSTPSYSSLLEKISEYLAWSRNEECDGRGQLDDEDERRSRSRKLEDDG